MSMEDTDAWAIPTDVYHLILNLLPKNSIILEFGSGTGTVKLAKRFKMISIEHDEKYLHLSKKSTYIHAPIVDYSTNGGYRWYDVEKIKNSLPKKYNLILIDGPPGSIGRLGAKYHLDMLDLKKPILVDDVNRDEERKLALEIAKKIGTIPIIFGSGRRKCAIILNYKELNRIPEKLRDKLAKVKNRLRIRSFSKINDAKKVSTQLKKELNWTNYTWEYMENDKLAYEIQTGLFTSLYHTFVQLEKIAEYGEFEIEILSNLEFQDET